jgi:putative transposase
VPEDLRLLGAPYRATLFTTVLAELHDEWVAFPRRYLSNESMDALYPDAPTVLPATSDG